MKTTSFDIIVVGAGMVGAALALAVARAGWHVAVLDRAAPPPFDDSAQPDLRVSALSAGSEQWLRKLGVWSGIERRRAAPYRRLSVWDAPQGILAQVPALEALHKRARTTFDAADLQRSHLGHIVENPVTQAALWDALAQEERVELITPASLQSLTQHRDHVDVHLHRDGANEGERTLSAQLVIGADGAGSVTRERAGIGTSKDQYQQQAMVISVSHEGPPLDITWQAFHPTGPRAYLPLPTLAGQCWGSLVWYDLPERLDELGAMSETELMSAITAAFPEELPALQGAPARGRFPLARQHAHYYHKGRVVLVGDAAHTINPLAGQGLNLGFQDARYLSELLLKARRAESDPGALSLLQDYEQERRPENTLMMTAMDLFYHAFSNRHLPVRLARNLGLGLAGQLGPARDEVARYAMGLDSKLSAPVKRILQQLPLAGSPQRQPTND